jgi:Phage tail assembly chaperone protein
MKYTAYNDNGKITSFGTCLEVDFLSQGKNVIEGHPPNSNCYIDKGNFVIIPNLQFHNFNYESKKLVVDEYQIRSYRSQLLSESDWTQMQDVQLETKQAWATYRQALRDVTDQPGYPFNVIWPTPPQG